MCQICDKHFKIKNEVKKYKFCDFSGCDSCKKVMKKRFIASRIYADGKICSICEIQIQSEVEPELPDDLPRLELYDDNDGPIPEDPEADNDKNDELRAKSVNSMDRLCNEMDVQRLSRLNSIQNRINNKTCDQSLSLQIINKSSLRNEESTRVSISNNCEFQSRKR